MQPIVYLYHVKYAETAVDAAAIMDNARMCGATEVSAKWNEEMRVYVVEYRVPREESEV